MTDSPTLAVQGARSSEAKAPRPVSGTDVAEAAGVSQKTVSRVVNGDPHVRADVRERVQRVIAELGYRPNRAARSLVLGRTRTIGLLSVGSTAYGPSALMVATERCVRSAGYGLMVVNTLVDEPGAVEEGLSSLLEQGVDGIVVNEPVGGFTTSKGSLGADVPVLSLSGEYGLSRDEIVVVSDEAGGVRQAVGYLLDMGHSTVHHIAGPPEWRSSARRLDAWRAALEDNDVPVPDIVTGNWSVKSGYAAGARLAEDRDVTAIFAANDEMAIGAMRALTERGRRLPQDISVVGFDDIPEAAYLSPALTTVRQDLAGAAMRGVTLLLETIAGAHAGGIRELVPTELIPRETVAELR